MTATKKSSTVYQFNKYPELRSKRTSGYLFMLEGEKVMNFADRLLQFLFNSLLFQKRFVRLRI